MVYSKATAQATAEEWRALGFYYESDDDKREWRFVGSKAGLHNLVDLLYEYASNPANMLISEHQHYGPYMYLKIATASDFGVGEDGIRGTLANLRDLGRQITEKIESAEPESTVVLTPAGASPSGYRLVVDGRQEGFDPASADPQLGL